MSYFQAPSVTICRRHFSSLVHCPTRVYPTAPSRYTRRRLLSRTAIATTTAFPTIPTTVTAPKPLESKEAKGIRVSTHDRDVIAVDLWIQTATRSLRTPVAARRAAGRSPSGARSYAEEESDKHTVESGGRTTAQDYANHHRKTFPNRTEGSVKKHWYKDMHYADFAENESAALLTAIKEYEASKWKVIGAKVGKPAKVKKTLLLSYQGLVPRS
ncbi:MAG: hypothetical protein Q9210_002731 [Variospora velana]